jgi:hypothetical protein
VARRLNFLAAVLHDEVIDGLRWPIRLLVLHQRIKTLDDTILAAKVSEAAATATPDANDSASLRYDEGVDQGI